MRAETFKLWSLEEEDELKKLYRRYTAKEITQKMNRTWSSVRYKIKKLSLPKTPREFLKKCKECGLIAKTNIDLDKFRRDNRCNHGRSNLCKKCNMKLYGWNNAQTKTYAKSYRENNTGWKEKTREKWLLVRRVLYRRKQIMIKNSIKQTKCDACERKLGEDITQLNCHHWKYEYALKDVIKNPQLALHNTSVLCFICHKKIGDPLRNILEQDLVRVKQVISIMPREMKNRLQEIIKELNDSG